MAQFRTQDAPVTGSALYLFTLPKTDWFIREFLDAIYQMTLEYNWEQTGTTTIEEATNAAQDTYWSATRMIGMIIPIATSTMPDNVLPCDGRTLARVDYPELYLALDDAFIVDEDYLRLPDLRGRAVVGAGQGTGLSERLVGDTGGAETHQLSTAEMPVHTHADTGHIHTTHLHASGLALAPGELPVALPPVGGLEATSSGNAANSNAGSGNAHNNMQPFLAIKYGIVAW